MKTLILLVSILFLFPNTTLAADEWDKEDIALQTIFTIETIIDWKQTKQFIKDGFAETNPFLGSHPSQRKIDIIIGSSILLHAGISHILPKKYRNYWQLIWIGIEGQAIHHNYQAGVKITF